MERRNLIMKYVDNYWAEELPNGVIHLLINCKTRELYFHAFSDTEYLIAGTEEEFDNWGDRSCILTVPKFLPENENIGYIRTLCKEKDQLSYYFIPYERRVKRNSKIILDSDER